MRRRTSASRQISFVIDYPSTCTIDCATRLSSTRQPSMDASPVTAISNRRSPRIPRRVQYESKVEDVPDRDEPLSERCIADPRVVRGDRHAIHAQRRKARNRQHALVHLVADNTHARMSPAPKAPSLVTRCGRELPVHGNESSRLASATATYVDWRACHRRQISSSLASAPHHLAPTARKLCTKIIFQKQTTIYTLHQTQGIR